MFLSLFYRIFGHTAHYYVISIGYYDENVGWIPSPFSAWTEPGFTLLSRENYCI